MNLMKSALASTALTCVIASAPAHSEQAAASSPAAGQIWLASGFFSYHLNRKKDYNERNTGLAVEYTLNRLTWFTIGHYENSIRRPSTYLHAVYTPFELGPIRLGGAVGLLNGYPALRGGRFAPVALPVATSTFKLFNHDVGINLAYIPTISNRVQGAVAVQFKLRVW